MEIPLSHLIPAFRHLQLLYVALRIGLIAELGRGSRDTASLASILGLPENRLARIARGLVWSGIIQVDEGERLSLTDKARALLDCSPTSVAGDILFHGQFFYSAWGHLLDYVRGGCVPFEAAHGQALFDAITSDAALAREFNAPMAVRTTEYSTQIADLHVFEGEVSIVDVGGGEGRLLAEILRRRSAAVGVIFDLPIVRGQAERTIQESDLSERLRFEGGSMFGAVPQGADVYLAKWVLHDWDDASAIRILAAIRDAMGERSSVVVLERPMSDRLADSAQLAQADLNMLVLNGGAERTVSDYAKLMRQAGLRVDGVCPLRDRYGFSAIIGRRELSGSKAAQPGATDNPDHAQRFREDH